MMNKAEKYILMYKDHEVLSFTVDFETDRFEVIDKLERFDLVPCNTDEPKETINQVVAGIFNSRSISFHRLDYDLILQNTNSKSSLELVFKGHGLSLSNHYWFKKENENLKYDDINFFTNKWDDSFARAVLNGDYESLNKCDLNVPDVLTQGWAVKGWIYDNGPKLCKLGIVENQNEEALTEVLASKLAQRILKDDEVLKYELVKFGNRYASYCPCMINVDEELIPLSKIIPTKVYDLFFMKSKDKNSNSLFYKKLKEEYPLYYQFFVKLSVVRSLCFISDLHLENLSSIRNIKTGEIRPAPLYDLAGAFGSSRLGKSLLKNLDKSTYLVIYYVFSGLDKEWDYSWYDPHKLDGFEDEIKDILSKGSFYTPELIDKIIKVYQFQKEALEEITKCKEK